jgi:uncharacterized DUF497 family protein
VKIEFDPAKSEKNARERGLPFSLVEEFEWETSETEIDARFPYPEERRVTFGLIGKRLHVVCHTPIEGGIRVISFRKANAREVKKYAQKKAINR